MRLTVTFSPALLLAFMLAGCAMQTPQPTAPAPELTAAAAHGSDARPTPLVLVSIDGYRADYLDRRQSPALASMAANGVRAEWMRPAFPTLTFPNHYTLVTGQYPDHTGIINNTMRDPVLGDFSLRNRDAVSDGRWWEGAEPIWITASKQGLITATMFWPGSEAAIGGQHPDHWLPYDGAYTSLERVNQILAWLDLPAHQRPDFLTLYFDHVDHAGHGYGPDSTQVNNAIREVDAAIGQLVTGLKARGLYEHVNLVVVSDHGMALAPENQAIPLDSLIDLGQVDIIATGVLAGLNPVPGQVEHVADALLRQHPHMRCWRKGEFPARLHYGHHPRTPEISCLADSGWKIVTTVSNDDEERFVIPGKHGYDNEDPAMRAIFIAHGPAFREGSVIGPFPNVDVYPLLAHLLDIKPKTNDGNMTPWTPVLRPAD